MAVNRFGQSQREATLSGGIQTGKNERFNALINTTEWA